MVDVRCRSVAAVGPLTRSRRRALFPDRGGKYATVAFLPPRESPRADPARLSAKNAESINRIASETASASVAELAVRRVSEWRPHRLWATAPPFDDAKDPYKLAGD
jgi:hypothetical protein